MLVIMRNLKASLLLLLLCSLQLLNQSCIHQTESFTYSSEFYKAELTDTFPFVKNLTVDALGNSKLANNPVQWMVLSDVGEFRLKKIDGSNVEIRNRHGNQTVCWRFEFEKEKFKIISIYDKSDIIKGIDLRFDKNKNHVTLLGIMTGKNSTRLPALIHFPDMGTFSIFSDRDNVNVSYDASRMKGNNYISVVLPPASKQQPEVTYTFSVTSVYPDFPGVEQDKFAGFRRNYLNLYQVNPRLQVLANNSCSDPCAFTLFLSSMLALKTPALADSLMALDLLRMSVERYLNGMKAYGMSGYNSMWEDANASADNSNSQPYDYLDTYPSLVISACNYIKGTGDTRWAEKYYKKIKEWIDTQMKRDYDKNGLVEYELSGNSGSWNGIVRPANWWDTIGFGHEDAFSNAITYNALNLMTEVADMIGEKNDAILYRRLATRLKSAYFKTFYNPATGIIAGWKSSDGKLHDYYFLMVNSMAVYYGLIPDETVKDIMMKLWIKMEQAGFSDFTLGLPGNLIPVRREDYTHPDPRWGGGKRDDGSDAFQRYENGGASLNWSFFTLKAFQKAGLKEQYGEIADGLLKAINDGSFQGSCYESEMTKDWKAWNGDCWGYEGFLCDGFLALLAMIPED